MFKRKKKFSLPAPPAPRPVDEIKKEIGDAMFQIGNYEYQIYVQQDQIRQLNEKLVRLNTEGAERMKLDEANKPKEEASSEQS